MILKHSLTPHTHTHTHTHTKPQNGFKTRHYIRPDTIKLLKENIARTLFDINHSKDFFDLLHIVMKIKTKIKMETN